MGPCRGVKRPQGLGNSAGHRVGSSKRSSVYFFSSSRFVGLLYASFLSPFAIRSSPFTLAPFILLPVPHFQSRCPVLTSLLYRPPSVRGCGGTVDQHGSFEHTKPEECVGPYYLHCAPHPPSTTPPSLPHPPPLHPLWKRSERVR